MSLKPEASVDAHFATETVECVLTNDSLDAAKITQSVQDVTAGATAVFIGTTRNSFKALAGKTVTRLEYQAYSAIAIKTMFKIGERALKSASRSDHQPDQSSTAVLRCAIHHRLGTVPIGEPSIVIAVSSPHRKEAFVACEEILEEVKRKAQIWKREYYDGEDENEAEWKANN